MSESVESHFLKWRTHGDPDDLAAVFDVLVPRLLGLALHLCGDPAEAEDVLQETFVAAMQGAANWDAGRPLSPWLSGILARLARRAIKRHRRTLQPKLAPPQHPESSVDHDAQEIVEVLRTKTAEFPSDARALLLLRLEHDLSPAEIAEVVGRSPGTVRVQLQRALARLRRVWPASLTLSLGLTALPSRGLAVVRAAVLKQAATIPPLASGTTAATALLGTIAMKKLSIALTLVLCSVLAWWIVEAVVVTAHPTESVTALTSDRDSSVPSILTERIAREVVDGETADPSAPALATASKLGSLELEVVWAGDGSPAVDVGLALEPDLGPFTRLHRRETRTDENGRARFDGLEPREYRAEFDRCHERPTFQIDPGTDSKKRIEIPVGVEIEGVVLTRDGIAVPEAQIYLSSPPKFGFGRLVVRSDATGTFRLRDVEAGSSLTALSAGWASSERGLVDSCATGPLHIELRLTEPSIAVRGQVIDVNGAPVIGAEIVSGGLIHFGDAPFLEDAWQRKRLLEHRLVHATRSDAEGRFLLFGAGERWIELWVSAVGFAPLHLHQASKTRGPVEELVIELPRGCTLEGTMTDALGVPIAEAGLKIVPLALKGWSGSDFYSPTWIHRDGRSDTAGRYRIEHLPLGEFVAQAGKFPLLARITLHGADGEAIRWDPVLGRGGQIRGRVLDKDGRGVANLDVAASFPNGQTNREEVPVPGSAKTDAAGMFVIGPCASVPFDVQVRHPTDSMKCILASQGGVLPDGPELELRVANGAVPSSLIRGRTLESDGAPLDAWLNLQSGARVAAVRASPDGRFEIGSVLPGSYLLTFGRWGMGTGGQYGPFDLRAGEQLDVGELRLQKGGTLELELVDASGQPARQMMTLFSPIDGRSTFGAGMTDEHGRMRLDELLPGEYLLSLSTRHGYVPASRVLVESGSTISLHLAETRHPLVVLKCTHPATGRPERVVQSLFAADGTLLWLLDLESPNGEQFLRLAAGTYRLLVESSAGLRGEREITVPAGEAGPLEFDVELRSIR